ncbi:hypothetical protein AB1Y20_014067 [Prymnesium parvum]|uniref:Mediator of RNA polymerase II transcription subunit 13 n=1 Tax=Prymnesium parvum TaxID=97485 RepID=A0AB34IH38_PRYPA
MWLLVDDHAQCGLVQRTRFELSLPEQPLDPLPPGVRRLHPSPLGAGWTDGAAPCWLYAELRLVLLIDLRRASLLSDDWGLCAGLEQLLASLAAPPPGAARLTTHVTVALASREAYPLRVLIQGWRHTRGEPIGALRALVLAQLARVAEEPPPKGAFGASSPPRHTAPSGAAGLAIDFSDADTAPFAPPGAEAPRREGLHRVVEEAMFCVDMMPRRAAPSVVLFTDAVSSGIGAPALPLRQQDVCLVVILLQFRGRRVPSAFGLVSDPELYAAAAASASGLLLENYPIALEQKATQQQEPSKLAAILCSRSASSSHSRSNRKEWVYNMLVAHKADGTALGSGIVLSHLQLHHHPSLIASLRQLQGPRGRCELPFKSLDRRPSRALENHNAAAATELMQPWSTQPCHKARAFPRRCCPIGLSGEWAPCGVAQERLYVYDLPGAVTLGDVLHARLAEGFEQADVSTPSARPASSSTPAAFARGDAADGKGAARPTPHKVLLRCVCDWSPAVTVDYTVRLVKIQRDADERASLAEERRAYAGVLRVQLAVTAPLPFWLRFERARLRRHAANSAAVASATVAAPRRITRPPPPSPPPPLHLLLSRRHHRHLLRHVPRRRAGGETRRRRRLAYLVTALSSTDAAWHAPTARDALADSMLAPRLTSDITLVPRPNSLVHVVASLAVRPAPRRAGATGSPRVELSLRSDDNCAAVRFAAQKQLLPALHEMIPLVVGGTTLVHVWKSSAVETHARSRRSSAANSAPSTAVPSCKTPPGLSAAGFSPSRAGRQAPIHGVPSMEGLPSAMMGAPPVTLPRSQRSVPNSPAGSSPHVSSSPVARATNSPLLRPFASGNEAGGDHDAAAQEEEEDGVALLAAEAPTHAALFVRLLLSASGLVVVRARFFRAEKLEARNALLQVWQRVLLKCAEIAESTRLWLPLNVGRMSTGAALQRGDDGSVSRGANAEVLLRWGCPSSLSSSLPLLLSFGPPSAAPILANPSPHGLVNKPAPLVRAKGASGLAKFGANKLQERRCSSDSHFEDETREIGAADDLSPQPTAWAYLWQVLYSSQ